jgi:uncharacterized membrane protein
MAAGSYRQACRTPTRRGFHRSYGEFRAREKQPAFSSTDTDTSHKEQAMKQVTFRATVLAALLGTAGIALAQTTSIPAQPDPSAGGEASTMTPAGVANPPQRPDNSMPASREAVRAEARAQNRSNATTMVPKGEATTMINHQPNAMPQPTGEMSRAEVSQTGRKVKPQFGQKGERPNVVTNPTDKAGTGTPD